MNDDNNILIAEFMGMTHGDSNDNTVMIQKTSQGNEVVPIEIVEYHTSWNCLMPVLSKILDLSFQDDGDADDFYNVRDCMPDINHTYRAVVEFINQYNES